MGIKVFVINRTGLTHRSLRRYVYSDNAEAKCFHLDNHGYHNAHAIIDKGLIGEASTTAKIDIDKTDPRWPKNCACGYEFKDDDQWQLFIEQEYAMDPLGESVCTLSTAPAGAMWDADWYDRKGPDGHRWTVCLPNGHHWDLSSRASNCDSPCKICNVSYLVHEGADHAYEDSHPHQCWVQHGSPTSHVDKTGETCSAGAGSISSGRQGEPGYYHGYFHNGELVEC